MKFEKYTSMKTIVLTLKILGVSFCLCSKLNYFSIITLKEQHITRALVNGGNFLEYIHL